MAFKDNRPIYLQIAELVMDKVSQGTLPAGERIPSVREYAVSVGVNPNTVMRSYDWLQQSGIIYNRRGIGYFVADDAPARIDSMRREDFFQNEIGDFFGRLHSFGVTPEKLAELYSDYLSKTRN